MKRTIIATLAAGLAGGMIAAAYAKLPPAPPKSDADKAAEAEKAAATKAKEAELLNKAHDKAVANHKKTKGGEAKSPASMDGKK
jgi:hypothetical protein